MGRGNESGSAPATETSVAERVVLIEDEEDLRGLVAFALRADGWVTHAASTGQEGLALVASLRPAIVVLDLMLPDLSGIDLCRRLRTASTEPLGIIIVSARGDEYDRLLGFESGADDYVVKPFSVRELALRVRALRRSMVPRDAVAASGPAFRWRGLELDPIRHQVRADGSLLVLRPVEFKILLLLMSSAGRAFSRAELGAVVWEKARDGSLRTIDTHVSRLREVLGPYAPAVETVAGVGYRLGSQG
jgi:two-component system phosphate regulon response regulator PhoB